MQPARSEEKDNVCLLTSSPYSHLLERHGLGGAHVDERRSGRVRQRQVHIDGNIVLAALEEHSYGAAQREEEGSSPLLDGEELLRRGL